MKYNLETMLRRIDNGGTVLRGRGELVDTRYYFGTDMLASAQGITNDGRFFYCTGTVKAAGFSGLSAIDIETGTIVMRQERYMPRELSAIGCDHYGGCTYFDAKIYVAVEDKNRANPCIAVFSAEDLTFTGQFVILPDEIQPDGNLPWCAADKENRLLYTGYFYHCDHINVFDIDTLEFIKHIPISRVVEHTQGAEMHGGLIYISCHDTWAKKHIFSIDPATGKVTPVMERAEGRIITESEGMTIVETEEGLHLYQLDVLYPFGLAVRKYRI